MGGALLAIGVAVSVTEWPALFKKLTDGVSAPCADKLPGPLASFKIPLDCVKCTNGKWSFNGDLSMETLKGCVNGVGHVTPSLLALFPMVVAFIINTMF